VMMTSEGDAKEANEYLRLVQLLSKDLRGT
jgi:hypothetical protein